MSCLDLFENILGLRRYHRIRVHGDQILEPGFGLAVFFCSQVEFHDKKFMIDEEFFGCLDSRRGFFCIG